MTDNEKLKKLIKDGCDIFTCGGCCLEYICKESDTVGASLIAKLMLERNELVAAVWGDDEKHSHETTLAVIEAIVASVSGGLK